MYSIVLYIYTLINIRTFALVYVYLDIHTITCTLYTKIVTFVYGQNKYIMDKTIVKVYCTLSIVFVQFVVYDRIN